MATQAPRDVTIQVRVTAEEKEALQRLAASEETTISTLLYPDAQELARQAPEAEEPELPDYLTD